MQMAEWYEEAQRDAVSDRYCETCQDPEHDACSLESSECDCCRQVLNAIDDIYGDEDNG